MMFVCDVINRATFDSPLYTLVSIHFAPFSTPTHPFSIGRRGSHAHTHTHMHTASCSPDTLLNQLGPGWVTVQWRGSPCQSLPPVIESHCAYFATTWFTDDVRLIGCTQTHDQSRYSGVGEPMTRRQHHKRRLHHPAGWRKPVLVIKELISRKSTHAGPFMSKSFLKKNNIFK